MSEEGILEYIDWFHRILETAIRIYFCQDCEVQSIREITFPCNGVLEKICRKTMTFDKQVVVMLAFMPHLCPQVLNIFFIENKNFVQPYRICFDHPFGFIIREKNIGAILFAGKVEKP